MQPQAPVVSRSVLPFWSSRADVLANFTRVRAGRGQFIRPPRDTSLDVKILWEDRFYPLPAGRSDRQVHLVRQIIVPRPTRPVAPDQMLAWKILLPADSRGKVIPDQEKKGQVLAAYLGAPVAAPFGDFGIPIREGQAALRRRRDPEADITLLQSLATYLDALLEAKKGAYALSLIHTGFEIFRGKVDQAYTSMISEHLRPFCQELALITRRAARDGHYRVALRRGEVDYAAVAGVLHRELEAVHRLSHKAYRDEQETYGRLEVAFGRHCRRFLFEGKSYPNFGAVIEALRKEPGGVRRRGLFQAFAKHCDRFYRESGGFYETIKRMNRHARKAGLKGYTDHIFLGRFGFTEKEFDKLFREVMAETRPAALRHIRELSRLKKEFDPASKGIVYAWDYHFLDAEWTQRKIGGKEPALTLDQAMKVARRVFLDLGIDLDAPPYNQIVLDLFPRRRKANVPGMAVGASLGFSYFALSGNPRKRVTLRELQMILHELAHTVSYQAAGLHGGGYHFLSSGDFFLHHITEGLAETIGNLIKDPQLARRYFQGLEGFTEGYFKSLEEVTCLRDNFTTRMRLLIAWMEANLYRDRDRRGRPVSVRERLRRWRPMLLATQGLEDSPDGISFPLTVSHLTYQDYHLYYAAYPLGQMMTDRLFRHIVKSQKLSERVRDLRRFGRIVLQLMRKGATLTAKDLEEIV